MLQHVWVSGPESAEPGTLLSADLEPMDCEHAQSLALDLRRPQDYFQRLSSLNFLADVTTAPGAMQAEQDAVEGELT
ncbi:hypothetical protein AB0L85_32795 [Streptomyces sp. NPDC052051]|uniref:hypothetical protein n=1 Tax=Streptomyces sp. NPDC052051 TaxID=3154649 RepID=UPI0034282FC4